MIQIISVHNITPHLSKIRVNSTLTSMPSSRVWHLISTTLAVPVFRNSRYLSRNLKTDCFRTWRFIVPINRTVPIDESSSHLPTIDFNIIFRSTSRSHKWQLYSRLSEHFVCKSLISPLFTICNDPSQFNCVNNSWKVLTLYVSHSVVISNQALMNIRCTLWNRSSSKYSNI